MSILYSNSGVLFASDDDKTIPAVSLHRLREGGTTHGGNTIQSTLSYLACGACCGGGWGEKGGDIL